MKIIATIISGLSGMLVAYGIAFVVLGESDLFKLQEEEYMWFSLGAILLGWGGIGAVDFFFPDKKIK